MPTLASVGAPVSVEINKGSMVKLKQNAGSVIIADPTIADVQVISPKLLFIHGKKVGETSIYAVDSQDNTILDTTVEVTHNLSKLSAMVKKMAPDADVSFRSVDGGLVMKGAAGSIEQSEQIRSMAAAFVGKDDKMVNMLTTNGSDQVMLQVKVVEMARSDLKRFGINLTATGNIGAAALQFFQGLGVTGANRTDPTTSNIGVGYNGKNFSVNGMIDALESQGLVSILAEPSLTTQSGKTANFLAGGEFPIPVAQGSSTGTTISIEYKPFGVGLNFTPVVMGKDRISMTVSPEVSTLDFNNPIEVNGFRSPIINTRKAQSTVELGSGQTFAMAGLLRNDSQNSIDKFPVLGDIPVLGALFRSHNFQTAQTELVILVTPYIVRPVSDHSLQTPLDGFVQPDDTDRILMGKLYEQEPMKQEDEAEAPVEPKLNGTTGLMEE